MDAFLSNWYILDLCYRSYIATNMRKTGKWKCVKFSEISPQFFRNWKLKPIKWSLCCRSILGMHVTSVEESSDLLFCSTEARFIPRTDPQSKLFKKKKYFRFSTRHLLNVFLWKLLHFFNLSNILLKRLHYKKPLVA